MSSRNSRTARPFAGAVLAVSVGLVLLPACSGADTSNGSRSPSAASSSSAPAASIKAVGFDETYHTEDGIVVQITKIAEEELGAFPSTEDPDAKEGDPYVVVGTNTTNRTKALLEFVPSAVLKYGPEKTMAAQVHVEDNGAPDLEPDEADDCAFGFIIPSEFYDQVVMEVTVTTDPPRTVVFSGSIKPT